MWLAMCDCGPFFYTYDKNEGSGTPKGHMVRLLDLSMTDCLLNYIKIILDLHLHLVISNDYIAE